MIAPSIRSASWVSSAAPVWVSRAAATRNALREPALTWRYLHSCRAWRPADLRGRDHSLRGRRSMRPATIGRRDHQEHRLSAWAAMRPRELPEAAAIGSRTRYGVPLIRLVART